MKYLFTSILLLALLISCTPAATNTSISDPLTISIPAKLVWWRDAVFYEIFVRSFNDSNADGIGDFNGIAQKLDYLQSLGITAIWLMPIHPSPSYHGYDVLNYYDVNSEYGSMADFKQLLKEAHNRGMRVIIDLVLNHTSSQHPWFVDANNNPQSPYRNWYIWSDAPQGEYWHPGKNSSYFGLFSENMPDLNYLNPEVTAQMQKITTFWLNDIGIDGFRVDAAKHLIENNGKTENTPATHQWLKGFYSYYKTEKPESYVVGEVFGAGGSIAKTYTDQLDQIFNFELASGFVNSANGGSNSGVNSGIKLTQPMMPDGQYATFLTNHDQNRVMSVMNGNVDKARIAASLLLTAQGTPFIYYGEEIGMTGQKPDEDIRLPMQWTSNAATAGFSTATPWRSPGANIATANVAAEDKDPASLLSHYRKLIRLRNEHPALRTGALTLVQTSTSAVFASLRTEGSETILVLINLTGEKLTDYNLTWADSSLKDGTYHPETLFGSGTALSLTISSAKINAYQPLQAIQPYSTTIFSLK